MPADPRLAALIDGDHQLIDCASDNGRTAREESEEYAREILAAIDTVTTSQPTPVYDTQDEGLALGRLLWASQVGKTRIWSPTLAADLGDQIAGEVIALRRRVDQLTNERDDMHGHNLSIKWNIVQLNDELGRCYTEISRLRAALRRRNEPPSDQQLADLLAKATRSKRNRTWRTVAWLIRQLQAARAELDEVERR